MPRHLLHNYFLFNHVYQKGTKQIYLRDEEKTSKKNSACDGLQDPNFHGSLQMTFVAARKKFKCIKCLNYLHASDGTLGHRCCGSRAFRTILRVPVENCGANDNHHRHCWYDSGKEYTGETSIQDEPNNECYYEIADRLDKNTDFFSSPRLNCLSINCETAGYLEALVRFQTH